MVGFKRKHSKPHKEEEDDFSDFSEESEPESGPESEPESEDEEGIIKLAAPSKTYIFNREGLREQLEDISWPENVDWIHKLTIDIDQDEEVDVNDDLTRELSFYNQALEGTRQAFDKLQKMNLPFLRPPDYYAEMVKTDSHMVKVKGRLLEEKKRIEEADERRKARDAKKISKSVQAEKLKDRAIQKKSDFEAVKKWRKQRQQSGFEKGDNGEDMDFSFENGKTFDRNKKQRPGVRPGDRSGGLGNKSNFKGKKGGDNKGKKSSKERRDSKFGFGGKKGMKKQNTADSTNDFGGFNKGEGNKKRRKF
ncbi:hypothetical protein MKW94_010997 [Papaver nudicaule]|uniref:rRNA processing protein EBP2 n=1 Tax=Papaver nudicaule TaxID=74823 RepID=A0AA41S7F9_PAPNU|nr:hypothetical protein [Papaver nudicaule]